MQSVIQIIRGDTKPVREGSPRRLFHFGPITTNTAISTKTANPMIPRASKNPSQAHSSANATASPTTGMVFKSLST